MNKIVELLIDWDNNEYDELGVDIMSLVSQPAIGYHWQAFSEEFETYNDYPEGAKNNAKRALEWVEEHGWGDCGESTGKARANQLAKGENISEDTIARMASFKRHQQHKDVPYSEGCGGLMWDAWGGTSGVEWASNKLESIRSEQSAQFAKEKEDYQEFAVELFEKCGESFGIDDVFVELKDFEFLSITDIAKGITSLDILGKRNADEEGVTKYVYTGPISSNSRNFCKAMIRMNKLYSAEELVEVGNQMRSRFASIYPDRAKYDEETGTFEGGVAEWMGGPNCSHYWNEVEVFSEGNGPKVVVSKGRADGVMGETMASRSNGGRRFSNDWHFSEDDQMIITGPAMVADLLIPRRDSEGNTFHVYFSPETVKDIAQKFVAENKQNNTDINHDDNVVQENTLLESWIVENPAMDKSTALGFDVPKNTWMVSMKINNEETWQKIKSGELKGFSVAGDFAEKLSK